MTPPVPSSSLRFPCSGAQRFPLRHVCTQECLLCVTHELTSWGGRNLNHANIVGLLAASEHEGTQHAALVWESAEHDDLHPALPNADAWRALSTSMKLACVADVAEALDYLHSQSPPIIHGRTTTTCLFLIRFCLTKLFDRHTP
jgi:hypothetical protein